MGNQPPIPPPTGFWVETPPKRSHILRNVGLGCGGLTGLALVAFLILAIVATAANGGATTLNTATTATKAPATSAPATKAPDNTSPKAPVGASGATVGGTLTWEGVAVTLDSVRLVTPNQDDQPPARGDSYYALRVTMVNHSSSVVAYNEYDFAVYNGAGASAPPPFLLSVPINQMLNSGNLAPGGTVTGLLVAELPTHDNGAKLVWNPLFFDNSIDNAWSLGLGAS